MLAWPPAPVPVWEEVVVCWAFAGGSLACLGEGGVLVYLFLVCLMCEDC